MKNIGLDCRSGIATAAVSLPVFMIGFCLLLFFKSSSVTTLFFTLVIIACLATITIGMLQGVWTKKTYVQRLHKTTQALEELSLGKVPEKLSREKYVLCSDIKQCSEERTISDCLNCELYYSQSDLEKMGAIVNTMGRSINSEAHTPNTMSKSEPAKIIKIAEHSGFVRRDTGFDPSK